MKTLISFLGKGDYREVTYKLDGLEFKSKLSIGPIKEHFGPDQIYIVGTEESRWDLLTNIEYKKIIIPSGRDEVELWQIFDIMAQSLQTLPKEDGQGQSKNELIFDITHCFRSVPFFVVILARFIEFINKDVLIHNIFYGFIDNQTMESKIVDLAPLLDLLGFINSLNSLEKYGDPEDISELLSQKGRKLWESKQVLPPSLKKLEKTLNTLTATTKMTYIPQLSQIAEDLDSLLKDPALISEARTYFRPLLYMTDRLERMAQRFKISPEWRAELEIARWYNDNRHPSQALLVLREAIITHVCMEKGLDPYDGEKREQVETELNTERMTKKEPLIKLWDSVAQYRNKTAHALTKKNTQEINPEKAQRRVQNFIEEAENILTRGTE